MEADAHVGRTYIDAKARRFVSIAGVARVVRDPSRMHDLQVRHGRVSY